MYVKKKKKVLKNEPKLDLGIALPVLLSIVGLIYIQE